MAAEAAEAAEEAYAARARGRGGSEADTPIDDGDAVDWGWAPADPEIVPEMRR